VNSAAHSEGAVERQAKLLQAHAPQLEVLKVESWETSLNHHLQDAFKQLAIGRKATKRGG
jgi:hypothetical protein